MSDPYFYIDAPVFRNKLGVRDKTTLKRIEAELSRANMMLLYEKGFENFSPAGLCEIHFELFGDLYDWAGQYRHISLEKPEQRLCGRSVWYSRENDISEDLKVAFVDCSAFPGPNSTGSSSSTKWPGRFRPSGRCTLSGREIHSLLS